MVFGIRTSVRINDTPHRNSGFCNEQNLALIEDAAQAFETKREHVKTGSIGSPPGKIVLIGLLLAEMSGEEHW